MSGGAFNYQQYSITDIADTIENLLDPTTHEEGADYYKYDEAVMQEIRKGVRYLRIASIYAQRIDWLFSGDDGPDCFLERLEKELKKLKELRGIAKLSNRYVYLLKNNSYGLIRCPKCELENYALSVASGICYSCGFDVNKED